MINSSTLPTQMRHPDGLLDRSGEAGPRQPHPWSWLSNHLQTRGIRNRTATVCDQSPRLSPEIPKTVKHPAPGGSRDPRIEIGPKPAAHQFAVRAYLRHNR